MLKNYLRIALRNIRRNSVSSLINNVGLGLGIGVFILIMLFVKHEYSVDKFIPNADRIFRVEMGDWALLGPDFAKMLKNEYSEVEEAISVQFYSVNNEPVIINDKTITISNYLPVSNQFIDFFGFTVLQGNAIDPLAEPYSLVLTQSEATRLFGNDNPLGESITLFDKYEFTVTAVIEDPQNFHFSFNALMPFEVTVEFYNRDVTRIQLLNNMNNPTYVRLADASQSRAIEQKIADYIQNFYQDDQKHDFYLRPVSDIYFRGAVAFEGPIKHGNIRFINVMIIVAFLILILACINYINLSTARASSRAKEIGIRKVSGATKPNIVFQFLGESILTTLIALVIGVALVELFTPIFSSLVERSLSLGFLKSPLLVIILLLGALAVGALAGLYPALYLSSFTPAKVLKGEAVKGSKGSLFRKGLIVFQFTVSTGLIISTLVIFSQLDYFTKFDVGFDKEQIVNISMPRKARYDYDVFKRKVLQIPSVKAVSRSNSKPGEVMWQETFFDSLGQAFNYSYMPVDPDYIDLLGLEIIQGRNFEWDRPADIMQTMIVNETMVAMMGYKNPIDKKLGGGYINATVIGVVKDFNFNSLHSDIGPLGLSFRNSAYNTYNIKVDVNNIKSTIASLEELWYDYAVDAPFQYSFLNETFENSYRSEQRMGRMFGYFAFIAIFIGCMGLFGLSAHILQARVKEMGIRKVLGASTLRIIGLMGKEFALLVFVSNAIAWPIAYFSMSQWLQGFAYKTAINFGFFIAALIITLLIAFLTVSYHSWRTARANPVDALKYE